MINYNKVSKVIVTDAFLVLPEVKEIIDKYKHVGFTAAVLIQLELGKHKNAIGKLSALRAMSHKVGIQLKTLLKIMNECSMFVIDNKHKIFYMPRLRKKLHMPVDPTEEEICDICANGNVYFGYGEKKEKSSSSFEKDSKKISKSFQNFETQDAVNQSETDSHYKGKGIMVKSKDYRINDEDAEEFKFKEILNRRSWCRSVMKRHGINLEDDNTLGIFAKWLYNYCCSNDRVAKSATELRQYANNLLRKESRTRADFDRFYEEETSNAMIKDADNEVNEQPRVCYENMRDGVRFSCEGQVIPDDAPKQPAPQMAYSYAQNVWIPMDEYDSHMETIAFKRNMKKNKAYVKQYADVMGGMVW